MDDLALIIRLQHGDKTALNTLMQRYKHKLYAFICRYGVDDDTAYDIVQETFIRLYFKAANFNPEYNFSTWLYQIALNLCRDHSRRSKHAAEDEIDENLSSEEDTAEEKLLLKKQLSTLNKAIAELPHKLKTALVMFSLEERSQEECAKLLGITMKALETRVYRAKKIIAERMQKV